MSTASSETPPVPVTAVPANEYERLLEALPAPLRESCKARISGAQFAANHPLFKVMADFYEEAASQEQPVSQEPKKAEPTRDFVQEATLHASQSKQLLEDFKMVPAAILSQIEPQLIGLSSSLTGPVKRLETAAVGLERNIEALPILLLRRRYEPPPANAKAWDKFKSWLRQIPRQMQWALSDHIAWIVCGIICTALAVAATSTILSFGAAHLARVYESAYQERLAHMAADSAQNTVALNRLRAAGITLKYERSDDNTSHFLILQGAQKAAQPVNSPEGLAVQVWP